MVTGDDGFYSWMQSQPAALMHVANASLIEAAWNAGKQSVVNNEGIAVLQAQNLQLIKRVEELVKLIAKQNAIIEGQIIANAALRDKFEAEL